jgi:hypothetical protein
MNQQQRAVVQQALEALNKTCTECGSKQFEIEAEAITALRQLLEQPAPVQEPVKFKIYKPTRPLLATPDVSIDALPWVYDQDPSSGNVASMWVTPVSAPAQPEPVQERKPACWHSEDGCPNRQACCDAQHCLYTTPRAQPADQPDYEFHYRQLLEKYEALQSASKPADHGDELTIAYLDGVHTGKQIAKREWVGLTDEELRRIETEFRAERVRTSDEEYLVIYPGDYWQWQRAIEQTLREKNGGAA